MLKFLLVFVALTLALTASAETFETTLEKCRVVGSDGDSKTCDAIGTWENVELKSLSSVTLPTGEGETYIRLEDKYGYVWEKDLSTCNGKPEGFSSCSARFGRDTGPNQLTLMIFLRDAGVLLRGLGLAIDLNTKTMVVNQFGQMEALTYKLTTKK